MSNILSVSNFATLRQTAPVLECIIVLGANSPGDGGGGIYYYLPNSNASDNGSTRIRCLNGGGCWYSVITYAPSGGGLPEPHASTHESGGDDEINVAGLLGVLANQQVPSDHVSRHEVGGNDELNVSGLSGVLADLQAPLLHAATHQNGGIDEISIAGLSGLAADAQTPLSHGSSHQNGGLDEINVAGLNGVLADAQNPTTHAASHQSSGGDAIGIDTLAAATDNTNLNATISAHGLLPKLGGGTANFLRADGTWATPASESINSVTAEVDFGATFADKAQIVVTGQAWVTANSNIVANILCPSGTDPDELYLIDFKTVVSNLVPGVGFTVTVYTTPQAKGAYEVMCLGA